MRNSLKDTYEKLRQEMYLLIDEKGLSHPDTIAKSQELDLIVVEMQKQQK